MHFDLTDLRLFIAIAEAGSITAGAERASLSLAAASARVRDLEHQAGVALLERGRRGTRLTAAGRALLRHAREVRHQVDLLRGEIGEYASGGKATLRVLANTAAIGEWLPELLADFLVAHPGIDLALSERGSEAAVDALREDMADIAVVAGHARREGLQADRFRRDPLVLVTAVDRRPEAAGPVALAQLLDRDFVGLPADSALQRHLLEKAALNGGRLRLRAQVQGSEAVCRMVARGAGCAILPEAAVRRCSVREQLACIALADEWAVRQLWIVTRAEPLLPLPVARLRDWLRDNAEGAP